MVKTIKGFYIANIIIFSLLIPLSFFLAYIWSDSAINSMVEEAENTGEQFGAIIAGIFLIVFAFLGAIVFVIACVVSLIFAIVGLVKIIKAQEPKDMKKLAIVQIIFIGNIVPAILSLKLKPEDFNQEVNDN